VEFRTEPCPTPGTDQVLVELAACGVCTFERRLFLFNNYTSFVPNPIFQKVDKTFTWVRFF